MSWDVVLVKYADGGHYQIGGGFSRDQEPLGWLAEVQANIKAQLPELDERDGVRLWQYFGMGFSIEFDFGTDAWVDELGLSVVGFGDPISVLVRIAKPNGWAVLDCADGSVLDLDRPSREGWVAWQLFANGRNPNVVQVRHAGEPRVLCLRRPPVPENAPAFAASIVTSSAKVSGVALDYALGSLEAVERIIDGLSADGETFQTVAETVFAFGCFLGEVVRRTVGGEWVRAESLPAGTTAFPLALRLAVGNIVADPIGRAVQRLERWGECGLASWASAIIKHKEADFTD